MSTASQLIKSTFKKAENGPGKNARVPRQPPNCANCAQEYPLIPGVTAARADDYSLMKAIESTPKSCSRLYNNTVSIRLPYKYKIDKRRREFSQTLLHSLQPHLIRRHYLSVVTFVSLWCFVIFMIWKWIKRIAANITIEPLTKNSCKQF